MAKLVLAIDICNSVTTVGLFDLAGALSFRAGLTTGKNATRDQCALSLMGVFTLYQAELNAVTGSILSSVVPAVTGPMCEAVALLTGTAPMLLGPGVKTGLNIKSDIHTQMGSDIVACSVAALAKYPSPVIAIDMGTATTMSYLRDGIYEGCAIMPGIRVALEALSDKAAELPHISIEPPPSVFGHNTVDAMRAGILYGGAGMLDGMVAHMEQEGGPAATVVATGLCATDVLPFCQRAMRSDPNLLLDGLYLIYRKNADSRPRKA